MKLLIWLKANKLFFFRIVYFLMVFFNHMTFVFSHYSAINAQLVIQIYSSSFNGQLVPRQQSIVIVFL